MMPASTRQMEVHVVIMLVLKTRLNKAKALIRNEENGAY